MCSGDREWQPAIVLCADCGKPMTDAVTRTRCRSCIMRHNWRSGVFAGSGERRWNRWRPEEDARLRELAGRHGSHEIAAILTRELGPRSHHAVRVRAHVLGVYLSREDWSLNQLCKLFGAHFATIRTTWLETGLLHGTRTQAGVGSPFGEWRVTDADLESFVRSHPWAYDAERMQPWHRLTTLAKLVQRGQPWLYSDAARQYLGISQAAFVRWCAAGVIPHRRRHVGRRGGIGGALVVSASDLPQIAETIRQRRHAARQYIQANLVTTMRARRAAKSA